MEGVVSKGLRFALTVDTDCEGLGVDLMEDVDGELLGFCLKV